MILALPLNSSQIALSAPNRANRSNVQQMFSRFKLLWNLHRLFFYSQTLLVSLVKLAVTDCMHTLSSAFKKAKGSLHKLHRRVETQHNRDQRSQTYANHDHFTIVSFCFYSFSQPPSPLLKPRRPSLFETTTEPSQKHKLKIPRKIQSLFVRLLVC